LRRSAPLAEAFVAVIVAIGRAAVFIATAAAEVLIGSRVAIVMMTATATVPATVPAPMTASEMITNLAGAIVIAAIDISRRHDRRIGIRNRSVPTERCTGRFPLRAHRRISQVDAERGKRAALLIARAGASTAACANHKNRE
jgi:hypothetical protein